MEEDTLSGRLFELYNTLLEIFTEDDLENQKLAWTALKILAISRRSLSILELAWAVALGSAEWDVLSVNALAELVNDQRVLSMIQPFIACADFSDKKRRQIRLVHQSVKEFVVHEWPPDGPIPLSSKRTYARRTEQSIERLEMFMLNICMKYLLLKDVGMITLFSAEQVAIQELPQDVNSLSDDKPVHYNQDCTWEEWERNMIRYDPADRGLGEFFVYAACHWTEHLGVLTEESRPNLACIEMLCKAGSTQIHNWIQQSCRPNCTFAPRFTFDSQLYDPIGIVCLFGSEVTLHDLIANSEFNEDRYLEESVFKAADQLLQWGDLSRVRLLFVDKRVGYQLRNFEFFKLVMKRWLERKFLEQDWSSVFGLVESVLDLMVEKQWGNELLCVAAGMGCLPVVQLLLRRSQEWMDLSDELLRLQTFEQREKFHEKFEHQSLGEAVLGNHVETVRYLLTHKGIEGHLQYRNLRGENVLHLACSTCNPEMFRLLIPRFEKGVSQVDEMGQTVLMRVIMSNNYSEERYEAARILVLERRACDDNFTVQNNPLQLAVQIGDLEMCSILLTFGGINPLSVLTRKCSSSSSSGQFTYKYQSPENESYANAILELLCEQVEGDV